jgi:hypothetical protein
MAQQTAYDTSIGSENRSVISATKIIGLILAAVVLGGIIMIGYFMLMGSRDDSGRRINSENTATRPAEP